MTKRRACGQESFWFLFCAGMPALFCLGDYNLEEFFLEGTFCKKFPQTPSKTFQKMGEVKNEAHLSRLARARDAIAYIGFFIALTHVVHVRRP